MAPESFGRLAYLAFCVVLPSGGCTWRSNGVEHYIGPVAFRYASPPKARAYVGQVVRWGIATEGGSSWGIALGRSERITVEPISSTDKERIPATERPRWQVPSGFFQLPGEGDWNLSLIYLRVDAVAVPTFFCRTIYGAEAVAGNETIAFSIGAVTRTQFSPPKNAFSKLHFDSARPMDAVGRVWPDISESSIPSSDLLREIAR